MRKGSPAPSLGAVPTLIISCAMFSVPVEYLPKLCVPLNSSNRSDQCHTSLITVAAILLQWSTTAQSIPLQQILPWLVVQWSITASIKTKTTCICWKILPMVLHRRSLFWDNFGTIPQLTPSAHTAQPTPGQHWPAKLMWMHKKFRRHLLAFPQRPQHLT